MRWHCLHCDTHWEDEVPWRKRPPAALAGLTICPPCFAEGHRDARALTCPLCAADPPDAQEPAE